MLYPLFRLSVDYVRVYLQILRLLPSVHPALQHGRIYHQVGEELESSSAWSELQLHPVEVRPQTKKEPRVVRLVFDRIAERTLNEGCARLARRVAAVQASSLAPFVLRDPAAIVCVSMGVRVVFIFAALFSPWHVALAVGCLQFLVAPLSFPNCVVYGLWFVPTAAIHYAANLVAGFFVVVARAAVADWWRTTAGKSLAEGQSLAEEREHSSSPIPLFSESTWTMSNLLFNRNYLYVDLDFSFLTLFLFLDFIMNCVIYALESERFSTRKLLQHVFFGTFQTKLYFVVVIGVLHNPETGPLRIDPLVLLLSSLLSHVAYEYWLADAPAAGDYIQHRLAHIPGVYAHAHKQHHWLHDTTAFDAHLFGYALNEEFPFLVFEILPVLAMRAALTSALSATENGGVGSPLHSFSIYPYFLNLCALHTGFVNKRGHTRTRAALSGVPGLRADNWHAQHHTLHKQNLAPGAYALLDVYFGTASGGRGGSTKVVAGNTPIAANGKLFTVASETERTKTIEVRLST